MKTKFKVASINVDLVNEPYDAHKEDEFHFGDTTFRQDGFSIGQDYMRFEGSTLTRGELAPYSLVIDASTLIGEGAFSKVHRGVWKQTKKEKVVSSETSSTIDNEIEVAIKQCCLLEISPPRRDMLLKELRALCKIDCECLLRCHGAFLEQDTVTTVLEYMDRGSLDQILRQCRRQQQQQQHPVSHRPQQQPTPFLLSSQICAGIVYQMLWGLSYLHHERILHRDIKPGNVLLHSDGQVKLCDFGIASMSDKSLQTTVCGTTVYMAPERLRSKPYGCPSDMWSLGLVLLECVTGIRPWHDSDSLVSLVITVEETALEELVPNSIPSEIRDVLLGCLNQEPAKRIPANLCLKCPWLASTHKLSSVSDAVATIQSSFLCTDNKEN